MLLAIPAMNAKLHQCYMLDFEFSFNYQEQQKEKITKEDI